MNISAVLSHMNKHKEALKIAKKANGMFLEMKDKQLNTVPKNEVKESNISVKSQPTDESAFQMNFIISYFNMGIAAERLGMKRDAFNFVNQGYHFAMIDLGVDHPVSENMRQYLDKLAVDIKSKQPVGPLRNTTSTRNQVDKYSNDKSVSMRPRTTSVYESTFSRAKTIAIDAAGRHRLRLHNDRDEVSIVEEHRQAKTGFKQRPKLLKDIRSKPKNLSRERSTNQSKRNDLTMLLEELAGRKKSNLKLDLLPKNQKNSYLINQSYSKDKKHNNSQALGSRTSDSIERRGEKKIKLEPIDINNNNDQINYKNILIETDGLPHSEYHYNKLGSLLGKLSNSDLKKLEPMMDSLDPRFTIAQGKKSGFGYDSDEEISSIAVPLKHQTLDIENKDIDLEGSRKHNEEGEPSNQNRQIEEDLNKNILYHGNGHGENGELKSDGFSSSEQRMRSLLEMKYSNPQDFDISKYPNIDEQEEVDSVKKEEYPSEDVEREGIVAHQYSDGNSGFRLRKLNQKYKPKLGDITEEQGSLQESKIPEQSLLFHNRSLERDPHASKVEYDPEENHSAHQLPPSSNAHKGQNQKKKHIPIKRSEDGDSGSQEMRDQGYYMLAKKYEKNSSIHPSDGTSGDLKMSKSGSSNRQVGNGVTQLNMTGNFNMKKVVNYNIPTVSKVN